MEHRTHTYAYALKRLAEEGKGDATQTANAFIAFMRARGAERLIPDVLRVYSALAEQTQKETQTHIHVADARDRTLLKEEIEAAMERMEAHGTSEEVVVDPTLIGGFMIQNGSRMFDKSYKRGLVTLFNTLTHTHNG